MDKTVMAYGKTFDALKANILTAALPYVQKYNGKTIVIKYGGNAMASETLKLAVMQDIILLSLIGIKVVLVHGGGPEITRNMQAMGLESKFINGLRYTDSKSVEVVQMTLCGKTNKDLVKLIGCCGGKAIGLCGLDGGMIGAKKIDADPDLGFVGDIISVNTQPITDIMSCGYIPVIAALGSDENGQVYNINADTAAAAIAKLVNYCADQADPQFSDEAMQSVANGGKAGGCDNEELDELFYEAGMIIINTGQASTSFLQRRLAIGNPRAARLMDMLEAKGVVGGPNGSKPREILVSLDEFEEMYG